MAYFRARKLLSGMIFNLLFICVFLASSLAAAGAEFHVAPDGSAQARGSQGDPFPSAEAALASGQLRGGDRLIFHGGEYGALRIRGARFQKPLTLAAAKGEKVHFEMIEVGNSRNLILEGFQVWPTKPGAQELPYVVRVLKNAPDITLRRLDVRSSPDATGYRDWPKARWLALRVDGIFAEGPRNIVEDSIVIGAYRGLIISGQGAKLLRNRVYGFAGDAMRALGDNSLVSGNRVRDCVKIDNNHDDGFQTFSRGPDGKANTGVVRRLRVENNIIREWVGPRTPLSCKMQGIFMGGLLEDLTVMNNVIMVSSYNGITGFGITRGRIVNNTVINSLGPSREQPWIAVRGHKLGGSSQVIIANNAATRFQGNMPADLRGFGNILLPYPARELRAPFAGDFRPRPGSALIDAGRPEFAPRTDIEGTRRPLGRAPDAGAYEVR